VIQALESLLHGLLALPVEASAYARSVDRLQYVEFAGFWVLGAITLLSAVFFTVRGFRSSARPSGSSWAWEGSSWPAS
jgi:ABC-type multidrug transport system permease subunit